MSYRDILNRLKARPSYFVYCAVALAVLGPMLRPGFILTLDMVFTPVIRLPEEVGSSYLFYAVLHYLDVLLPADVIQKVLLFLILFLSGLGMHRLLQFIQTQVAGKGRISLGPIALYAGGILYMVNPYTYDRFMAGQFAVLLGYALLPWFTRQLLQFVHHPGLKPGLQLAAWTLAISIVSIHTLGLLAIITACVLAVALWPGSGSDTFRSPLARGKRTFEPRVSKASFPAPLRLSFLNVSEPDQHKRILKYGIISAAVFGIGSCYWLIPMLMGEGTAARTIGQFDSAHAEAFAATGANVFSKLINVLQLQGFWAERHGLYLLPQDQLPGWGTVRLLIWTLVGIGAVALWRQTRGLAAALFVIALLGLLISIDAGQPLLTAIGYREPQKFTGLLALVFAICTAFGTSRLLQAARQKAAHWYTVTASGILLLVIILTPTMYWGFAGQLTPRHYPDGWFELNEQLNRDSGGFKVLFLPWHQYMSFRFAGRIIASPAPHFFDKPTVVSSDPELGSISQPRHNPLVADIAALLPDETRRRDLGEHLAAHGIKYMILTKDYDHREYRYLDSQQDLTLIWDSPDIKLYRNTAMEEK